MVLSDDYQRGLIQKSTYIRLSIASPRHSLGDSYDVAIPLAGVNLGEIFTEISLMARDELVEIAIAPFTVTWAEPQLLPSFSPTAVQSMQIGGRGYLYFALGADNQGKAKTQPCDPSRLYNFYKMPRVDFLAELGRLLETKTATVDISNLSVRWLNKSAPAAREFQSIAEVVVQLRKEIGEAIAKIPASAPPDLLPITTELNNLAAEINERQLRGDYALNSALNGAIANLNNTINSKQAAGDYALVASLNSAVDRIFAIESRPPAMPFALSINCGRGWGNPVLDTAGNHWIRDSYAAGGTAGDNGVTTTANTDIPWLYQEERYGNITYTIPVADGKYTVKLHFAENFNTAAGQRIFNVDIQGVRVLTGFDIFAAAGGGRRALVRSFPGIVVTTKQLIVRIYDPGTIMGIQLVRE